MVEIWGDLVEYLLEASEPPSEAGCTDAYQYHRWIVVRSEGSCVQLSCMGNK